MQKELEFNSITSDGSFTLEDQCKVKDWMGRTVCFRRVEHRKAYEKLTKRNQQYIAAYMHATTLDDVKSELKLSGSKKTISKTLQAIAKKMGCTCRELNGTLNSGVSAVQLKELIEQQDYRCAASGELLQPSNASLDHIVPVADGGTNELSNLQWLHAEVNRMKGTLPMGRFIELCGKIARWNS